MRAHHEHPDHARPGDRRSAPRSPTPTAATAATAATGLLALQRAIGNAAVTAALTRDRPARSQPARGVSVQRALRPADERLETYLKAMADDGERTATKAKRSPALSAFGRAIPEQLVDLEEQSANYKVDSEDPQGKPPVSGGRFENLYGRDEQGSLAVMMENYRNSGEEYTASEAFIHQWSRAVAMFNAKDFKTAMLKVPTKVEDVPDRLPDSIFRQNISGPEAKKALGELVPEGADSVAFAANDETYGKVLATVNGKSTKNIVTTFNEIKKLPDDRKFRIAGGAIKRDPQGNFQLRFDVTDRSP